MLLVTAGVGARRRPTSPRTPSALVEFLLGEEAQTYFAEETLEYPLAAGVEPVEGLFPLDEIVSAARRPRRARRRPRRDPSS